MGIDGNGNRFEIYQLKRNAANRSIRYMSMDFLTAIGVVPKRDRYKLVYAAPLVPSVSLNDTNDTLEKIFRTFNVDHPDDYAGRSLSVSDVIALKQDGVTSFHYVDLIGFQEIHSFLE